MLSLCIVIFVFTWLISALSLIISYSLLLLGVFDSFCSRAFRCAVKLLVYALSSFCLEALRAMSFPLRTAFIVSHKFEYVVASFSLTSKKPLISLFLPWPSYHWVGFHVYVSFLLFLLLLKTSLSPWWSYRIHKTNSIFLYRLRFVLCLII